MKQKASFFILFLNNYILEIILKRKTSLPDLTELSSNYFEKDKVFLQEHRRVKSQEKQTSQPTSKNSQEKSQNHNNTNSNCQMQIPQNQLDSEFHYFSQLDNVMESRESKSSESKKSNSKQILDQNIQLEANGYSQCPQQIQQENLQIEPSLHQNEQIQEEFPQLQQQSQQNNITLNEQSKSPEKQNQNKKNSQEQQNSIQDQLQSQRSSKSTQLRQLSTLQDNIINQDSIGYSNQTNSQNKMQEELVQINSSKSKSIQIQDNLQNQLNNKTSEENQQQQQIQENNQTAFHNHNSINNNLNMQKEVSSLRSSKSKQSMELTTLQDNIINQNSIGHLTKSSNRMQEELIQIHPSKSKSIQIQENLQNYQENNQDSIQKQFLDSENKNSISELEKPVFLENDSRKQITLDQYLISKQSKGKEVEPLEYDVEIHIVSKDINESLDKNQEINSQQSKESKQQNSQQSKESKQQNSQSSKEQNSQQSKESKEQNSQQQQQQSLEPQTEQISTDQIQENNFQSKTPSNKGFQQVEPQEQISQNSNPSNNQNPPQQESKDPSRHESISYELITCLADQPEIKQEPNTFKSPIQNPQKGCTDSARQRYSITSSSLKMEQRLSLIEETKQLVNVSRALLKRVYEEDDNQPEEFTNEKGIQTNIEPILAETGVQYENQSRNVQMQTNIIYMVNHMTQTKKYALKEKAIMCVPQQIEKAVQVKEKQAKKHNKMIQAEVNTVNAIVQTDESRPILIDDNNSESSEKEDNSSERNQIISVEKKSVSPVFKAKKQTKKNQSLKTRIKKSNINNNKRSNPPDSIRWQYNSVVPELNQKKIKNRKVGIASRLRSCDKKTRSNVNYELLFS